MRMKEMHPLCCISLESPGFKDHSPQPAALMRVKSMPAAAVFGSDGGNVGHLPIGSGASVAGILYKWTNYGKGWRSRWFLLKDGVLSYSKSRRPENFSLLSPTDDVRLIGEISTNKLSRINSCNGQRKPPKTAGIVHLKISSFRESRSDDKRFYIFTATKTLHLRTDSKRDRVVWIQALVSTRFLFPLRSLNDNLPHTPHDFSQSTERLTKRLTEEGVNGDLVKECEQIMVSEFSEIQGKLKVLCEERSNLLDTIRQLEAANIEAESSGVHDGDCQLAKNEYSSLERGKCSECSTAESSEDVEKQEEDVSDEDEIYYFDTKEAFTPRISFDSSSGTIERAGKHREFDSQVNHKENMNVEKGDFLIFPLMERRKRLPDPVEKEKGVSLWSMIKDNVGKDLTRVCLPVYFNEPISSLQKCFEDLEYSYLLDRAYQHGKAGNSLLRILYVAAFAVSGYASSEGRHCKPFNPLLGETYEADFPDKGVRFFSEKVSHHPTIIACHCDGRGWKFYGDSNLHSKFWGRSIQLDPVGVLTLEFDDGEIFQWSKVTTNIYNLILGKVYCDHHGTMNIQGNRQYSCKLKFKEQSLLDRNPRQVNGIVEDRSGKKCASLSGKWDDSMYYTLSEGNSKAKGSNSSPSNPVLLWRKNEPAHNPTRYNLTSFAITLNELTPGLKENLPPTDSRLRPDQRHLENGEYEKANSEKLRLERRQRMSRKLQENGWKPRWFDKKGENGSFCYAGGYWESREKRKWDECPNIFGEFNEEYVDPSKKS